MGAIFAPPRTVTKHKKQTEESLQLKVCRYLRSEYPDVIFFSDFAAGMDLKNTQRQKMIAMRSHDGKVPDLIIMHPSRGYHGLVIELKKEGTVIYKRDGSLRKQPYKRKYRKSGKLFIKTGDHLQEQEAMLQRYNRAGYCGRFGIGYQHIIDLIDGFMDRKQKLSF